MRNSWRGDHHINRRPWSQLRHTVGLLFINTARYQNLFQSRGTMHVEDKSASLYQSSYHPYVLYLSPTKIYRYDINGFVSELPQLPEQRKQHVCGSLPSIGVRQIVLERNLNKVGWENLGRKMIRYQTCQNFPWCNLSSVECRLQDINSKCFVG